MEYLTKYIRNKEQAKSGYNHTLKELLDEGVDSKIRNYFVDESIIKDRHNLFPCVRKVTFVFNDYPERYENTKQEIIVGHDLPNYKKMTFEGIPRINRQTLNMLVGTYIGSCFITQVVDGSEDGNIHIYLSLPS